MAKYPSQYTGQNFDTSVQRALNQFPGQISTLNTKVAALEEDVDDLSGLPQQVATIGLKIGDLANLQTTEKSNLVGAINEVKAASVSNNTKIERIGTYDVSKYNGGSSYTLANAIAAVPNAYQYGGVHIKFIDSSTALYTEYVLISSSWSTDTDNWKKVGSAEAIILSEEEYDAMESFDVNKIYFVFVAETYNVTNTLTNCTTSNSATTAKEMSSYSATLSASQGYRIQSVVVVMGGENITSTAYSNGVISIPSVTGNVEISATAVALQQFTITNNLSNVTNSNSATSIYEENSYTATLTADQGYYISEVVITMGGADVTSSVYSNGSINIPSVTGNLVITVATTSVPSYSITNTLTNCSTNNDATYANEGNSYTATLTPASGYAITTISVTMGGTDITSSAYSNGVITIASVTGDIVITAVGTAPVITINDAAAKAILVANFDTDQDGEINTMEAAAVTTLGTYFKSNTTITDISWLQYFSGLTTMASAFYGCTGVTSLDITSSAPVSSFNDAFRGMTGITGTIRYANTVAKPQKVAAMFYGNSQITSIDLTGLDVSNVATMASMFTRCTSLATINISGWALTTLKSMYDRGFAPATLYGSAFDGCSALTSIIMEGCNSDTLSVIEQALVLSSATIAQNVTISVDGVNHTYDGTNWN